jgi:hypothetical protein
MRRNWIAVASAEHARRGCAASAGGYMQVCHGKCAPLKRVSPGDRVAYYSPRFLGSEPKFAVPSAHPEGAVRRTAAKLVPDPNNLKDKCQSFVSIGLVQQGQPYAFDMGGGFVPYRRDVAYVPAHEAPIAPLLDLLEFVDDRQRWGYKFRFGLFEVNDHDMRLIAQAMGASLMALRLTPADLATSGAAAPDAVVPALLF